MKRLLLLCCFWFILTGCDQAEDPASDPTAVPPTDSPATAAPLPPPPTHTAVADPTDTPAPTAAADDNAAAPPQPTQPPPTHTPIPPGRSDAVGLELVADGFTAPVGLLDPADGSGRFFVIDQVGVIRVITADGSVPPEPFLDLRSRMVTLQPGFDERGLLGMALHPNFAENGRFFVYYSAPLRPNAPAGWEHTSHISEFRVSADDPNRADPASEKYILQVDQPQFNHNAGQLLFGPDGYLYIALGDGGGANDNDVGHAGDWYDVNAGGNGQVRQNLLGAILRIDVDQTGEDGRAYAIPPDNPFAADPDAPELYAYGLRNPFRLSFDRADAAALLAADVGQDRWEEVNLITPGGNYGWNVKEATHCFNTDSPGNPRPDCPDAMPDGTPLLDPVIEYANSKSGGGGIGLSVIGGYMYRGAQMPQFYGRYLFGDWSTNFGMGDGTLLIADPGETGLWSWQELSVAGRENGRLGEFILSFGQDADGELYLLTSARPGPTENTGKVYRLTSVHN